MKHIENYCGMNVVITDAITKKVRRRTHKKKRIDKKWLKRYGYKEVQDHSKFFTFGNTLYMSKRNYDRLKTVISKMGE